MAKRSLLFLFLAAALATMGLAACGGDDDEEGASPAAPPASADGAGDAGAGRDVFATAGCESCHTLAAAGSSGSVGPNLDELKPDFDEVVEQVTNGGGGMPAFGDQLSEQEIQDVAAFVVESTSGAPGATTTDGATTDDEVTTLEDDGQDGDNSGSGSENSGSG